MGKSGRVVNVAGQGERRPTYAAVTFSSGNPRTYPDVLDLGEGVGGYVVVAEERGEEGAGLALSTPLGDGGDGGAGDITQESVDVGGGI